MQLKDKVAIVTGAASGIGEAIALGYGKEGAHVVLADINETGVREVANEITAMGQKAKAVRFDVTDFAASKTLVADTVKEFGSLDILVNNAGICKISPIWDVTPEEWDPTFDVNVKGLFFLAQAACEPMRKQRSGKIINIASGAGRSPDPYAACYSASKASVISITKSFAIAMGQYKVNVNAIAPGLVKTAFWDAANLEFAKIHGNEPGATFNEYCRGILLGRPGEPEDIVPMAIFLAGSGSDYITGETYNVLGGLIMS